MKRILLLNLAIASIILAQAEYSFKLLTGKDLKSIVPFMVEQRIAAFREYPYLYEGNNIEENEYCQWFSLLPYSAVAVAYYNGQPVGFVSGTGFADFDVHFKGSNTLFKNNNFDPKKCYYIPEAIIVSEHRKNSLIVKLHETIEHHAKSLGFKIVCFAEESHDQHPLKPVNYKSRENLYLNAGYIRTEIFIKFPWLTIQADGSLKDEEHELRYWIKNI